MAARKKGFLSSEIEVNFFDIVVLCPLRYKRNGVIVLSYSIIQNMEERGVSNLEEVEHTVNIISVWVIGK
jgi:hypothetical protein